jgi:N-acetylglucosaminyldiphosphoundecaprenol N-acetyl-beta-D-mannosaminyltransferase
MKIKILNISVDKTTKEEILNKVSSYLSKKEKFTIVTPNPEIALKASHDSKLAGIINNSQISIPDGVGLKLADKDLTIIKGREMMEDLFDYANKKSLKIYLLGGTEKVNKKALSDVAKKYSNIKVYSSSTLILNEQGLPTNKENEVAESTIIKEINHFKPALLFVAFGAPKQEFWMDRWIRKLDVGGVMVVGGALDYFTGLAKKPPKLLSSLGLEWLWRLINDPRRIKRIFNALVVFPLTLYFGQKRID